MRGWVTEKVLRRNDLCQQPKVLLTSALNLIIFLEEEGKEQQDQLGQGVDCPLHTELLPLISFKTEFLMRKKEEEEEKSNEVNLLSKVYAINTKKKSKFGRNICKSEASDSSERVARPGQIDTGMRHVPEPVTGT